MSGLGSERARKGFKLTDEVLGRLIELVSIGNYYVVAAQAVGIGERTLSRWLTRGAEIEVALHKKAGEDHEYDESNATGVAELLGVHNNDVQQWRLWRGIQKADAQAEAYAVGIVRKHMPDQWTAAMTFLERKAPGRWRRREQVDIGPVTPGEQPDVALLSEAAQAALHDVIARESVDSTAVEEPALAVPAERARPQGRASARDTPPPDQARPQAQLPAPDGGAAGPAVAGGDDASEGAERPPVV